LRPEDLFFAAMRDARHAARVPDKKHRATLR
jgi:hypothetical protein